MQKKAQHICWTLANFKNWVENAVFASDSEAIQTDLQLKIRTGLLRYRSQRRFISQFFKNGQSRDMSM